ncbi:MAG: transposase [Betaproteobacteria bacterium]
MADHRGGRSLCANERLSRNARGQVVLKLKSPYRDGTTHIVLHPQEVMQRLAVRVPRPRLHLIRDHGVLAPNAKLRGAVIPQPARRDGVPGQEHTQGQAARMRWARLLKRVFHIHVERCACGGQLTIVAAIEEPVVIVGILTHLGLAARAPPRAAVRECSLDYAA